MTTNRYTDWIDSESREELREEQRNTDERFAEVPVVYWFTLGQSHTHRINGKTFDCDTVIEIVGSWSEARERMVELCGQTWSHQYVKGKLDLSLFPGGVHRLN